MRNVGDYALASRIEANTRYGDLDLLAVLAAALEFVPGLAVLDVACGNGQHTLGLKRRVGPGRTAGIDRSADLVRQARTQAAAAGLELGLAVADALALPFPGRSFDRIACSYAVYHFPAVARGLAEMRRVARPGGRIVLAGPAPDNNQALHDLHRAIGGTVGGDPGREVYAREVEAWCAAEGLRMAATDHLNHVAFPAWADLVRYYSGTKLFTDGIAPERREAALAELGRREGVPSLTKSVRVYQIWT